MGLGMLYAAAAAAIATGPSAARPSRCPVRRSWWLSLAWLAFAGSALAFACFLTLQDRLDPAQQAMIGVMTPLLALVVSLLLEGFRPDLLTALGAGAGRDRQRADAPAGGADASLHAWRSAAK